MDQAQYDSSMEELSQEELRMLASTKRQEPQGEEHGSGTKCGHGSGVALPNCQPPAKSETTRMDMISSGSSSSSPYSSEGEEDGGGRGLDEPRSPNHYHQHHHPQHQQRKGKKSHAQQHYYPRGKTGGGSNPNNASTDSSNSHSAYNTLIIHQNNSSLLADTWIPATHEFASYGIGNRKSRMDEEPSSQSQSRPTHSYSNPYENMTMSMEDESGNNNALTSSELSDIPRDYLNQLTVLKHLAKEVKQDPNGGTAGTSLLRSASFSKSQPDLTQAGQYGGMGRSFPGHDEGNYAKSQPPPGPSRKSKKHAANNVGESSKTGQCQNQAVPQQQQQQQRQPQRHHDDVLPSVQILEILMRENAALNAELVNARRKIATIHKLESELDRLQASHEALFASAERRESLERTARAKLSTELKRLTAVNRELLSSGSLQNLSPSPYTFSSPDIELLKKEIAKRDFTIAQILSQNKELGAAKERQDIELSAQRATLAEQRTHIDILDSALTNAQANVLRLEEECRKKQEFVDKSSQLQRALSSLQLTNDKREQSEKKVRTALEGEITDLKLRLTSLNVHQSTQLAHQQERSGNSGRGGQQGSSQRSFHSPPYTPPKYESNSNLTESQLQLLQEKLKVSEEQIYHLNSQVAKWENVFSPPLPGYKQQPHQQQQPMRTGASVSTPDTPNSWTNSNSRGGTPHFFGNNSEKVSLEELSQGGGGGGRGNDLEWKIKDLESRLMEKDAVIRILQTVPAPSPTGGYSMGNNSSAPGILHPSTSSLPSYRDSPGYSQASTLVMSPGGGIHPISVTLPSMIGGDQPSSSLLYSKGLLMNQKCESEPPSYANLPLKLRLGGSGSSLVKNSNESLQLGGGGGSTGGNSPNISGPGSVSGSTSGASGGGGRKSIDDQLKDLDNQLLSKDGGVGGSGGGGGGTSGSLKMHSGLCCIPGFAHPGSATRKGKISQSLLESLTAGAGSAGIGSLAMSSLSQAQSQPSAGTVRKTSLTPSILPPKPPSSYVSQPMSSGGGGGSRTSSGPPFISPSDQSPMLTPLVTTTTVMSLSNSVDSVLSDPAGKGAPDIGESVGGGMRRREREGTPSACNVFTPAIGIPKGLPPKPTSGVDSQAGKSRSLERTKYPAPGDPCAGKYTAVMYDGSRCRSLDRRELKMGSMTTTTTPSPNEVQRALPKCSEENKGDSQIVVIKEKEKESKKSSVSSKAAFFGQLLTRRSPSPGREKKEKEKEKESSTPKLGRRFPFGSKSQSPPQPAVPPPAGGEVAEERMMLDKQGRQSQRSRISSKWNSSNTLEAVEEQSGSESPWTCRKSKASPKVSKKVPKEKDHGGGTPTSQHQQQREKDEAESSSNKKWGRIVKSPFGLRYTFGSPRVAAPQQQQDHPPPTSSKQQEK